MKWSRVCSTLSVNKTNPISHFSKWNYVQFNFPCIKVDEKPNVSWLHRAPSQFWSVWEARMYSVGSVGKDQLLSALGYCLHSCLPTWSWSVWLPLLLAATQICLTRALSVDHRLERGQLSCPLHNQDAQWTSRQTLSVPGHQWEWDTETQGSVSLRTWWKVDSYV